MKNKFPLIVIAILIAFFYLKGIDKNESYSKETEEQKPHLPVYGEPETSSEMEYKNSSSTDESDIVSCPKCSKSYNRATWGEMCNTCWSDGKGLKSRGRDILK